MKTIGDKKVNGNARFTAFGQTFYYGFGEWHCFYHNAVELQNELGFRFKKDAINYARRQFKERKKWLKSKEI